MELSGVGSKQLGVRFLTYELAGTVGGFDPREKLHLLYRSKDMLSLAIILVKARECRGSSPQTGSNIPF
jgi:hypothetical protein